MQFSSFSADSWAIIQQPQASVTSSRAQGLQPRDDLRMAERLAEASCQTSVRQCCPRRPVVSSFKALFADPRVQRLPELRRIA